MRTVKIVTDSAANVTALAGVDFAFAPMKILTSEREFIDDADCDADAMVEFFDTYNGRSKTSCPGPSDWLEAFGNADDVFCVTITSGLSGSYNAACAAKQMVESEFPDRRVFVLDSLSAGPEMTLILEKLQELVRAGAPFEEICTRITQYSKQTGLLFTLESLKNFAANGRVSPAVAKITGLLNIRIVGRASDLGTLEPLYKCRGEAKSLRTLVTLLKEAGLIRGKVCIAHCRNEEAALRLKKSLRDAFPHVSVSVNLCRGLCSYYAEQGGLLVGFEKE